MFRVNARAGQQSAALASWLAREKPQAKVFYLGPDYEMGRSTVAAFKSNVERIGGSSLGEVFAPLDSKDYTQYFGQLRAARPQVLYTSVAGNDTVRLLTQLQEFGLRDNITVLGASGTVTSQNIGAIGHAAEGFVTGVGYSAEIDSPENKKFVEAFRAADKADPDLYGADSYGLVYAYKAAVEKVSSTDTDRVREGLRGLKWMTPQGEKTNSRQRSPGRANHVRREGHRRAVQDRCKGGGRGCHRQGRVLAVLTRHFFAVAIAEQVTFDVLGRARPSLPMFLSCFSCGSFPTQPVECSIPIDIRSISNSDHKFNVLASVAMCQ